MPKVLQSLREQECVAPHTISESNIQCPLRFEEDHPRRTRPKIKQMTCRSDTKQEISSDARNVRTRADWGCGGEAVPSGQPRWTIHLLAISRSESANLVVIRVTFRYRFSSRGGGWRKTIVCLEFK